MQLPALIPQITEPVRTIGRRTFDFSRQAAVMAVVNRTPDSFHDRGATFSLDKAVQAGLSAAAAGADWIDIGGIPFSPRVAKVSAAEEIDRVLPVVEAIATESDVVISVDTTRAEVAELCLAAGASVINDTSGLQDPELADVIRDSGATLVLTHSLAKPFEVLQRPSYHDVTTEVVDQLRSRLELALTAGITREQIVVDPGHDLNKNTLHTLQLTRELNQLCSLGLPVLAAVSNKDFVAETLDRRDRHLRLAGSLASGMWCLMAGARILRMHDVDESVDTVRMFEALMGWRAPAWTEHNL